MLPGWFVGIAIAIRLYSGGQYAWGVVTGKARPNPVTWFFWGLTPMVAFIAQIQEGPSIQSLTTLALGISPWAIFIISTIKGHLRAHLTPFTIACATITMIGIVLWQLTDEPDLAITFSILADITASLPTLVKAYKDPFSEYALPYLLSMLSMVLTLLTITTWTYGIAAFPMYMLAINTLLFLSAFITWRPWIKRKKTKRALKKSQRRPRNAF